MFLLPFHEQGQIIPVTVFNNNFTRQSFGHIMTYKMKISGNDIGIRKNWETRLTALLFSRWMEHGKRKATNDGTSKRAIKTRYA